MLPQAGIGRLALAALALAGLGSCSRRQLGVAEKDAGGDGGAPSLGDAARIDVSAGDVRFDVAGEVVFDGAGDVVFDAGHDVVADVARDVTPDLPREVGGDAPPATCPAAVAPLDVCGCGCCSPAQGRDCYYPTLGESRDTVPNPMPTPQECATTGCSPGVRYLCCFDPGPQPVVPEVPVCATNTSEEDLPLFAFTKRDAIACTTIQIGSSYGRMLRVSTPFGPGVASAWRGPCDGTSAGREYAIGGVGSVTLRPMRAGDTTSHYDVHVTLFFDSRTGTADIYRIDVDDIAVAPPCASAACPLCVGACAFDASYRYGFTGGRVAWVDLVTLAPPASYEHRRSPVTTMPADIVCQPPPPGCGAAAIDVAKLMIAFADPDVQQAFTRSLGAATIPFYGQDARPSDGQAFQITRDGGGGFLIGGPCPTGSTPSSCMEIPGGLGRLMSLLIAFDQQQLQSDPACVGLLR